VELCADLDTHATFKFSSIFETADPLFVLLVLF